MIAPLGNRVLLRPMAGEQKTPGGLFLPPSKSLGEEDAGVCHAQVVAVGQGRELDDGTYRAPRVAPGDIVLFVVDRALAVRDGSEILALCSEGEILAKVSP